MVGAVVVAAMRLAAAAPMGAPSSYPLEDVDRPLVHPAGMTTLDVGLQLWTFRYAVFDASGDVTSTSRLEPDLDVALGHSFGPLEVTAGLAGDPYGPFVSLSASYDLASISAAIEVSLDHELAMSPTHYNDGEDVAFEYKALLVPHRCALFGNASLSASEGGYTAISGSTIAGDRFAASIGASGMLQVTSRLALSAGGYVAIPLATTGDLTAATTTLNPGAEALLALGHWDLYGWMKLYDALGGRDLAGEFGFVHRWGR
jgi:hypothetical protein